MFLTISKIVLLAILPVAGSNLFTICLQGFVIVDRALQYGTRSMVDQHRDMRMDIDNMSYEVIIIDSIWISSMCCNLYYILIFLQKQVKKNGSSI